MGALALLHGFTGRGASWRPTLDRLDRGEAWAPDLPGHGGAREKELPGSFEDAADRLASRLEREAETPVHLVGYSLGGRLALAIAVRRPRLVGRLTLIGARPGLGPEERARRAAADDALARGLLERGLEPFLDSWQALPLFASQRRLPKAVLEAQSALRLGHSPAGLAWALRTLSPGRMPDYRPRLQGLKPPVDLVVGELDAPYLAIAREMQAGGLPRTARLRVVPGCGHNVPLEAPAALAPLLAAAPAPARSALGSAAP
ncbi:MAG: alpha/beta fold hydrolase [Acidobacteriota bacterium]